MTSAVERLTRLIEAKDRHDIPLAELLPAQMEAANERLTAQRQSVKLLANRVESSNSRTAVAEPADLVPLLFAHTAYKSYPESWLSQGNWDRMGSWLDTVTANRVRDIDTAHVKGIDDWVDRLADKGHYICCSSGTTGKVSIVPSALSDRQFVKKNAINSYEWATGLVARNDYRIFACNPGTNNFRFLDSWSAFSESFGSGGTEFTFPGEPITAGKVREMVMLRKSIADGSARPGDIAAFEAVTAQRTKDMAAAADAIVEAMLAARGDKLLIAGMPALLFQVAETIRELGYDPKDFHPENTLMTSGGLKGAVLPPDYLERMQAVWNIDRKRVYAAYAMQELNTFNPRCEAGRFHVPPWLILLPLDAAGETLLEPSDGEVEGRAAFLDLSMEGRWGGIISGDKIHVRYGKCECGHEGPTIGTDISRYSDLPGGDKITCSGTIDAYVRGVA
jgi:hypothetical protein